MVCVHQEGSGFEDFDSDAEIIRVSELPLSVTSDFFFCGHRVHFVMSGSRLLFVLVQRLHRFNKGVGV